MLRGSFPATPEYYRTIIRDVQVLVFVGEYIFSGAETPEYKFRVNGLKGFRVKGYSEISFTEIRIPFICRFILSSLPLINCRFVFIFGKLHF